MAADPDTGLPTFLALPATDRDVAWIIRENRRKDRLTRLPQREPDPSRP